MHQLNSVPFSRVPRTPPRITQEERLLKFMKVPPKKKMEWLCQMHELIVKSSSKRDRTIRWKLRKIL